MVLSKSGQFQIFLFNWTFPFLQFASMTTPDLGNNKKHCLWTVIFEDGEFIFNSLKSIFKLLSTWTWLTFYNFNFRLKVIASWKSENKRWLTHVMTCETLAMVMTWYFETRVYGGGARARRGRGRWEGPWHVLHGAGRWGQLFPYVSLTVVVGAFWMMLDCGVGLIVPAPSRSPSED